jgi:ketosteroid isomerase-like protein
MMEEEHAMSNENAELIRRAYEAYASGDLAAMLEFVDPDLEGLTPTTAGVGGDRAYSVFTVREGRIVALRDCRDRQEALQLAGLQP